VAVDDQLVQAHPRALEQPPQAAPVELAQPSMVLLAPVGHRQQQPSAGPQDAPQLVEGAAHLAVGVVAARLGRSVLGVVHPDVLQGRDRDDGVERALLEGQIAKVRGHVAGPRQLVLGIRGERRDRQRADAGQERLEHDPVVQGRPRVEDVARGALGDHPGELDDPLIEREPELPGQLAPAPEALHDRRIGQRLGDRLVLQLGVAARPLAVELGVGAQPAREAAGVVLADLPAERRAAPARR